MKYSLKEITCKQNGSRFARQIKKQESETLVFLWWEKVVATRNFNYSEIKELLPEIKFLLENDNTN